LDHTSFWREINEIGFIKKSIRGPGRGYQFVESAGEMTLYVELYDSITGDMLVKAMDRKGDRRSSSFQFKIKQVYSSRGVPMFNKIHKNFIFAVVFLLSACASGPQIQSDFDPSVDFSQYKTFGFFDPMRIEGENYSTLFGQQFRTSIRREMTARGYVESSNPDLGVNVSARLQEKTKVTQSPDPMMHAGYYGYRRGYYDPWMSYGYGTTTNVSQYTQGTVNVDIVDLAQKRMVWEGVAIGKVKEGRSNSDVRTAIDEGVTTMFEGYPAIAKQ
jgi:hypothetical protein